MMLSYHYLFFFLLLVSFINFGLYRCSLAILTREPLKGVEITNFSSSFADGMAFIAILHHFYPSEINMSQHTPSTRRLNFETAFRVCFILFYPIIITLTVVLTVTTKEVAGSRSQFGCLKVRFLFFKNIFDKYASVMIFVLLLIVVKYLLHRMPLQN